MRRNYFSFTPITMWIIIVIYSVLVLFFIQKQKTKVTFSCIYSENFFK